MSTSLNAMQEELRRNLELAPTTARQRAKLNDEIAALEYAIKEREELRELRQDHNRLTGRILHLVHDAAAKLQRDPPPQPADVADALTQLQTMIGAIPNPRTIAPSTVVEYSGLLDFAGSILRDAASKAQLDAAPARKSTLYAVLRQISDIIRQIPRGKTARLDATLVECQVDRARSLVADIAARLGTGVNTTGVTSPIRGLEIVYELVRDSVASQSPLIDGLNGVSSLCSRPGPDQRAVLHLSYDSKAQLDKAFTFACSLKPNR